MAKTITKLPDAPSVERPGSFNQDADKFVRALGKFTDEANALALAVETAAKTVQDAAFSAQPILDAKDEALRAISAATTQLAAAQNIKADAEKSAQKAQSAAQAIEAAKNSLASAGATLEEMKKIVSNGFIDDTTINESRTYSSKKIEDTFQKKGAQIDAYTKSETNSLLGGKVDSSVLNSVVTNLQNEITTKISQAASGGATRDYVKNFTKAVSVSSATIYFSSGINFYLDNPAGGPVLKAGDLNNPDNFGKSGLVYIGGTSIQSLSPDFVPINPDEATFSKGYVFFSYFFHPVQKKIIVQYLKDSTK